MTTVFTTAGSEELSLPFSILSICLGVPPLYAALYVFA